MDVDEALIWLGYSRWPQSQRCDSSRFLEPLAHNTQRLGNSDVENRDDTMETSITVRTGPIQERCHNTVINVASCRALELSDLDYQQSGYYAANSTSFRHTRINCKWNRRDGKECERSCSR